MNLSNVANVARREYLARVRSKAFIIFTLMPLLIFGMWGVIAPLIIRADVDELRIEVIDAGSGIGEPLAGRLAAHESLPITIVQSRQVAEADLESVRAERSEAVRRQEIDGYLVLRPDPDSLVRAAYYARETGNIVILETLEAAVERSVLESLFSGEDLERIRQVQGADLNAVTVSEEGEEAGGFLVAYASTFAFGILLYMAVLMQGQQMATAIVEEKSSKLIELIIGAVTATEYMIGKILGVMAVGLTQLAAWVSFAAVGVLYVLPGVLTAATLAEFDLTQIVDPRLIGYLVIFFVLGYLMYSTLYAAVGATCSSTEELQHALFPVAMPVIIAFISIFYVMTNPSSSASRVLSLIPLFTPLTMLARVNVSQPPLWEVWLGIVLLLGFSLFCVWLGGKIFRVAILMHGKRPALGEIIRMARAA